MNTRFVDVLLGLALGMLVTACVHRMQHQEINTLVKDNERLNEWLKRDTDLLMEHEKESAFLEFARKNAKSTAVCNCKALMCQCGADLCSCSPARKCVDDCPCLTMKEKP